ncbi:MAPEG family protein [Thalassotalea agarivorans]|uniref:Uncharacterized conserved protein, MAPEG superfamily n=1 Tax=Thalassotalea agarivorans TaxID=349064 RepID=A0A1H9ZFX0_THASX|nr:MAPEG family protein [Thalassotalea agarivorans]SES80491.1 Uncharacterized conserved protein, MAPEG superfamily [Thalassotalea agarivorans]
MTILILCLTIAALLPFLAKAPVAIEMNKLGGYNNKFPREQQKKLEGMGARALAAHHNAFESFIVFAPAVLLAVMFKLATPTIVTLAVIHVLARVAYNFLYLANKSTLRSLSWTVGIGCSFAIYILVLLNL